MTRPGRPRGRTPQGESTRKQLYDEAIRQFGAHGYEATTLRGIAAGAEVSPGLIYRYFPSKLAVVLALYEELSTVFVEEVELPEGPWAPRFLVALQGSLGLLRPHREVLVEVLPVLLSDRSHGLLSEAATGAREQVRGVFVAAVVEASPSGGTAALGRLLYLLHLNVLLWWILDRSEGQRATEGLLALLARFVPAANMLLWLPGAQALLEELDALAEQALMPPSGA